MKISFALLLILSFVTLQSCENKTREENILRAEKEEFSLSGTWTLYKEVLNGMQMVHSSKPMVISLTIKENDFYLCFDKITDLKITGSSIYEIQERYKGQCEKNDNTITMNHLETDSLVFKNVTIEILSLDELVLKENTTKNKQYLKNKEV